MPLSAPTASLTLTDVLDAHAQTRPAATALRYLDRGERESDTDTYATLVEASRRIGSGLAAAGLAGQAVILLLPQGLDFVRAFLGCLRAGAIAVPVPSLGERRALQRTRAIVAHAAPGALICPAALMGSAELAELAALAPAGARLLAVEELKLSPPPAVANPGHDIAFLQYTSGTTSAPKGVVLTQGNISANLATIAAAMGQTSDHRAVSWLPLHHDMGLIGNVLTPLFLGAQTTLMSPRAFLQKPLRWLKAIERYGATTSGAPNFGYDLIVRLVDAATIATLDLSRWTLAYCGAEPVRAESMARFARHLAPAGFRAEALYPCYGLAEATLFVTGGTPGSGVHAQAFAGDAGTDQAARPPTVACGWPHGETRVELVEGSAIARTGEVGEICVSGPAVSPGFWDPQSRRAVPDEARAILIEGQRFLRTGDLGRWQGGELHVVGRLKNMVIVRGTNHYAEDIEATVRSLGDGSPVLDVAVFPCADGTEGFVIACERRSGESVDDELWKTRIAAAVAEHHGLMASAIMMLAPGGLARTPSGKILRGDPSRSAMPSPDITTIPAVQPATARAEPGALPGGPR